MRTLLILGLCATAMMANAQSAKRDTVTMYVIDGNLIKNFNGSQLRGKTIKTYFIDTTESWNNRVIVVGHAITTTDAKHVPGQGIRITTLDGEIQIPNGTPSTDNTGMPLIIVDGAEALAPPTSENIISIEMFEPGSEKAKRYGERGGNGVMYVTTKKMGQESAEQIVVIDGKKSTEAELKALDSKKIKSVTLLKGDAAKEYTDNPNVGVVIVTTKKK